MTKKYGFWFVVPEKIYVRGVNCEYIIHVVNFNKIMDINSDKHDPYTADLYTYSMLID